MRCQQFDRRLWEFLDGSLSAWRRAAAEQHLSGCARCRGLVQRQRQLGQHLSGQFAQATQELKLRPEVERTILSAWTPAGPGQLARPGWRGSFLNWKPWAWAAAAACVLGVAFLAGHFANGHSSGLAQRGPVAPPISHSAMVQLSYQVPTYRFQKEGSLVRDTLIYQTVVVNGTLPEAETQ